MAKVIHTDPFSKKKYIESGELRPPRKGECYLDGGVVIEGACTDFEKMKFKILLPDPEIKTIYKWNGLEFVKTGENRLPKEGEWFVNNPENRPFHPMKAYCDFKSAKADILELLRYPFEDEKPQTKTEELISNCKKMGIKDPLFTETKAGRFRAIIEGMAELYEAKNADYGDSFSKTYKEYGPVASAIRLDDKLGRYKALLKSTQRVKDESIKDTLMDLASYAIMTIMELEKDGCDTKDKGKSF